MVNPSNTVLRPLFCWGQISPSRPQSRRLGSMALKLSIYLPLVVQELMPQTSLGGSVMGRSVMHPSSSSSAAGAPSTTGNTPKAFLGKTILHHSLHGYGRKRGLDLISSQYSFRPSRVFRFSLIECYQRVE